MFRASVAPIRVQWGPQLYTKDGRPRARRPISAFHRVKWSTRLPYTISVSLAVATCATIYRFYSQSATLTPQQRFMNRIAVVPHGVLGSHMHDSASLVFVADSPDYRTAVVDPAGLHHIHGVADGAGGAAAAIYNWLGIKGEFPEDVRLSISAIGDAKLHRYPLPEKLRVEEQAKLDRQTEEARKKAAAAAAADPQKQPELPEQQQQQQRQALPGSSLEFTQAQKEQMLKRGHGINDALFSRAVIHAIGPDFRAGKWTDREASLALARGYRNILHEFVMSDCDTLRIAPLSAGIFSGPLYNMMPVLTQEALAQGFDQLHEFDKEALLQPKKRVELCIFMLREWDSYVNAFDYIVPPEQASVVAASTNKKE